MAYAFKGRRKRGLSIASKRVGKQRRHSFATVEQLSVTDARKEAGRLLAEVRIGGDPAEDKRKRIEVARAQDNAPKAITLGEAAKRFLTGAETRLRPNSLREVRRYLTRKTRAVCPNVAFLDTSK